MKTLRLVISCFFLCSIIAKAQISYGGMQQIGLSFNENGTDVSLAVTNGVRFKQFFTGVGVSPTLGSNTFGWRTTALYLDGRYYVGKSKRFFGKMNAGVNLITDRMGSQWGWSLISWEEHTYHKQVGFHGVIGAGFKARLTTEVYYSFDISYGFTQMRYQTTYDNFLRERQKDKYDLRRTAIVLQMGLEIL